MEKREMTATELMSELGWKKSKVYYWINSNKFETIERETGKNVLITTEQIERLKSKTVQENFEQFENSSNNSEIVQENSENNVTKHYETVSNNFKFSENQFYLESLNTIKSIHQSALNNFNYSMKLLTDGKNELEEQFFELKANNKTLSEKVEQKETELKTVDKKLKLREYIIIALSMLFIMSTILYFSELSKKFEKVQPVEKIEQQTEIVEQSEPKVEQIQTVQNSSKVQATPKTRSKKR